MYCCKKITREDKKGNSTKNEYNKNKRKKKKIETNICQNQIDVTTAEIHYWITNELKTNQIQITTDSISNDSNSSNEYPVFYDANKSFSQIKTESNLGNKKLKRLNGNQGRLNCIAKSVTVNTLSMVRSHI